MSDNLTDGCLHCCWMLEWSPSDPSNQISCFLPNHLHHELPKSHCCDYFWGHSVIENETWPYAIIHFKQGSLQGINVVTYLILIVREITFTLVR